MAGATAKERRLLKRQQARKEADGDGKAVAPGPKPTEKKGSGPDQAKVDGGKDNDATRLRLQRKMARKASGKFKAQSQQQQSERPPPPNANASNKRKSKDINDSKSPRSPSKVYKKSPNHQTAKKNVPIKNKNNPRLKKDSKQPAKKNNKAKHKANKPKHLKRKMDQLSKTVAEGNNGASSIAELEGQMKLLAEQMEKLKELKQNDVAVDDRESPPAVKSKEDARKEGRDEKVAGAAQINGAEDDLDNTETESNEASDDSPVEAYVKDTKSDEKEAKASSSSLEDDSSSDEDEIGEDSNTRSRGKRRRGRKDSKQKEERSEGKVQHIESGEKEGKPSADTSPKTDDNSADAASDTSTANADKSEAVAKKTPKKDDKRRCIGRKPVTDYVIGKTYSGKVRYIKPKLGAFIDLGSHSDAFCHISCVSDEFVSSVTDVLKVDDGVDVRVVEIDREKKRITVSLRSEDVAENEQERLKTTRQYEDGVRGKSGHVRKSHSKKEGHVHFGGDEEPETKTSSGDNNRNEDGVAAQNTDHSKPSVDLKRERKLARRAERRSQKEQAEKSADDNFSGKHHDVGEVSPPAQSGPKTGADLKRERKLARRAERRAAREAENGKALQ